MREFVRLDVDEGVGVIRLDRAPANAIDLQVGRELIDAIGEADDREGVGAIVVWGGPKIFAAGADIKAMAQWGPAEIRPSVEALGAACDRLASSPLISIAAVNGYAMGGGMELAMAADLRLVADDAKLGQPEISLGVIPGAGGTQRLTWLVGPARAAELIYTGRVVEADEALALGLTHRIEPAGELFEAAVREARRFANGPREALAAAKHAIASAVRTPGPEGIARERELFVSLFGSPDQREGMQAFLDKREPRFGDLAP